MPTRPLPSEPSLVQLRKQARELQSRLRSGDAESLALLAEHVPPPTVADTGPEGRERFPLHLAQLTLARSYGVPSWPRLVAQVGWVQELSRTPDVDPPDPDPVSAFLLGAVLRYGADDGPQRWADAARMLAEQPWIGRADIYAACARADHAAVEQFLARHPGLAAEPGGVMQWEPLLYLTYSRLQPVPPQEQVVATARALLAAGADPNAGFLWHGLTSPFTALTGVFGSGEQGTSHQPPHPYEAPLARLLLEAGADANDGQTLYNRMFEPDNSHLAVLLEFGLGAGEGGPWHRRLPDVTASPTVMVAKDLAWAISHGMVERIELLAEHGVDLNAPLPQWGGRPAVTPVALALHSGLPRIAALLVDLGATEVEIDPETRLVGALLSGDADQVAAMGTPRLLARIRRRHPALILRAAVAGSSAGVELLLANGFDVNALGRQDIPVEQEWETALHHAAGEGDLPLARRLLAAGADPNVTDRRFGSTPLGWAEHFGRAELADLLRPLTGPGLTGPG